MGGAVSLRESLLMPRPKLRLYLAAPRGFCAGVDRAIKIVEVALQKWGAPVYVRHEIVHNRYVVEELRQKGAVFVEELDECPEDRPVIFSAHGVPKSVPEAAKARNMIYVDATCPLVAKVHIEAQRHFEDGLQMVMIGHAGHPETIGTMGQLPKGEVLLVETVADVEELAPREAARLAYITQTTLSVDDTSAIVDALQTRFPAIIGPHKEDICYATTNRQAAVKAVAPKVGALLVIGAPNSSNSRRLVEVARSNGCAYAQLVQRATDIDWRALEGVTAVGITAGASAPEVLINEVIAAFGERYEVTQEIIETAQENIEFKIPRLLRESGTVDAKTLAFYQAEAAQYSRDTAPDKTPKSLTGFAARLPKGGDVLDLGCGGGWASAWFRDQGFGATALDASALMIAEVEKLGGIKTICAGFEGVHQNAEFDGIWASFSLQHVARVQMPGNLARIAKALRPGGWLYIGIHEGDENMRDDLGRFYSYYGEAELRDLLGKAGLTVESIIRSDSTGYDGRAIACMHIEAQKSD